MNTDQLIEILLGVVGTLVMIIWSSLIYEIRKLRAGVHSTKNKLQAMSMVVSILCKRCGITWEKFDSPGEKDEE